MTENRTNEEHNKNNGIPFSSFVASPSDHKSHDVEDESLRWRSPVSSSSLSSFSSHSNVEILIVRSKREREGGGGSEREREKIIKKMHTRLFHCSPLGDMFPHLRLHCLLQPWNKSSGHRLSFFLCVCVCVCLCVCVLFPALSHATFGRISARYRLIINDSLLCIHSLQLLDSNGACNWNEALDAGNYQSQLVDVAFCLFTPSISWAESVGLKYHMNSVCALMNRSSNCY